MLAERRPKLKKTHSESGYARTRTTAFELAGSYEDTLSSGKRELTPPRSWVSLTGLLCPSYTALLRTSGCGYLNFQLYTGCMPGRFPEGKVLGLKSMRRMGRSQRWKNQFGSSILFVLVTGLWAQIPIKLGNPYPRITISPGQVTTLYVTGASTIIPLNANGEATVQASTLPLPTVLAGFSGTITQEPRHYSAPLPIFSVMQENVCSPPQQVPACVLTLLTVHIPIDVEIPPFPVGPGIETTISLSENGSVFWSLSPPLDPLKIHILTACDPILQGAIPTQLSPCNPLITHADGSLVGPFSGPVTPAQPGETLVMYATGLGSTQPAVPAGSVAPIPAAVSIHHFSLIFDYNCGTIVTGTPVFVGLTPGQVGLYQVNFKVPPPVPCTPLPSTSVANSGGNLTLLSDDWVSSDTVLLYVGANIPAP